LNDVQWRICGGGKGSRVPLPRNWPYLWMHIINNYTYLVYIYTSLFINRGLLFWYQKHVYSFLLIKVYIFKQWYRLYMFSFLVPPPPHYLFLNAPPVRSYKWCTINIISTILYLPFGFWALLTLSLLIFNIFRGISLSIA